MQITIPVSGIDLIAKTTTEENLVVTLPLEIYTDERIAEFDQAESELARWRTQQSRILTAEEQTNAWTDAYGAY